MAAPSAKLARAVRPFLAVRPIRLASGVVLFAYVLTHLLNHAVLSVSLEAGETVLEAARRFWHSPIPTVSLYGALLCHLGLGLWSLYERPRFAWRPGEASQLALGLAIPPLLVAHVVGTRIAYAIDGSTQGYAQLLYVFWIASPLDGALQATALVVAWAHGCFGIYFWLRLKPWFSRVAPALLIVSVLVPTFALFGYLAGGREVIALAADEGWRVENVPIGDSTPAGAEQLRRLGDIRTVLLLAFAGMVAMALGGRMIRRLGERRNGLVRLTYPDGRVVAAPRGITVLEASRRAGIRHASVCGGRGRCSTCRVRVGDGAARLTDAHPDEQAVLDRVKAGPGVRLACQLRPEDDLAVTPLVAPEAALRVAHGQAGAAGEERFVVAMFVDMRGSTRLAERHLPFDTVYLINRFLDAVARAVTASGGAPNQFLGDGLMALFGLSADRTSAARGAIAAVSAIGREITALNALLEAELRDPIQFGIGVHAGTAILGEIGSGGRSVFTAIGDPINVAARLQSMTKRLACEAVVSDAVFEAAGTAPETTAQDVAIEGRAGSVSAHALARAEGADS